MYIYMSSVHLEASSGPRVKMKEGDRNPVISERLKQGLSYSLYRGVH